LIVLWVLAPHHDDHHHQLVDGRFLWDTLHARMNPIGRPYEDVYSWLACIGINPCWQWYAPRRTHRTRVF
jgi:hypothetical protein